jgi:hypothetical protein
LFHFFCSRWVIDLYSTDQPVRAEQRSLRRDHELELPFLVSKRSSSPGFYMYGSLIDRPSEPSMDFSISERTIYEHLTHRQAFDRSSEHSKGGFAAARAILLSLLRVTGEEKEPSEWNSCHEQDNRSSTRFPQLWQPWRDTQLPYLSESPLSHVLSGWVLALPIKIIWAKKYTIPCCRRPIFRIPSSFLLQL